MKLQIWSTLLGIGLATSGCMASTESKNKINLAGKWSFRLDSKNIGIVNSWQDQKMPNEIILPGTVTEGGFGNDIKEKWSLKEAVPKQRYIGSAWYKSQFHLPKSWQKSNVSLYLERARWKSTVWINGSLIGDENSLCTPHEYEVSSALKSGTNSITICMDNREIFNLGSINSMMSNNTQGNWNGIVGRIELIRKDKVSIKDLQLYPDIEAGTVRVVTEITNQTQANNKQRIRFNLTSPNGKNKSTIEKSFTAKVGTHKITFNLALKKPIKLWDESNPQLYHLETGLVNSPTNNMVSKDFGMREISFNKTHVMINGKSVYMRGTLECANFPLTRYAPMELEPWMKIMKACKSHGMNHIRFHSWTPPEAAFMAGDKVGMYLLTEAPRANIGPGEKRDPYILREALRINRYYGNYASYTLFSSGNELHGKGDVKLLSTLKTTDSRHLYSFSSGGRGMTMNHGDITLENFEIGGPRGCSFINTRMGHSTAKTYYDKKLVPRNDADYGTCNNRGVPVIAHELGQWVVYPSMAEIKKYTGVMVPVNLFYIRDDLKKKGLLEQAQDFTRVTAKHAALFYKEEIETMLRTPGSAGFSLLQLNDYPGQGTAHVGLYDGFWDSKGAVTPESFRQFCGERVPLLRLPKYTYTNDEILIAQAELFNYSSQDIKGAQPYWELLTKDGSKVEIGEWGKQDIKQGSITKLGKIRVNLSGITKAQQLTIKVKFRHSKIVNAWNIWVYPKKPILAPKNIIISHQFNESVRSALNSGKTVLLLPNLKDLSKVIRGRSVPPFWSPVWWWTRAHRGNVSMSIFCNPSHPVFKYFPTEEYTTWQWAELLDTSSSFILDDFPRTLKPIVQVVDNFSRNHKLANTFEAKIGKGKILVCGLDLSRDLAKRPVANQFRYSLLKYMESSNFNPQQKLTDQDIRSLYKKQ